MNYQKIKLKEGINLHNIETNKFKTNLLTVFITTPLLKDTVTKESLLASVLRRGTASMPSTEEISISLEDMYGASFDCGIEKIGTNHIVKFYLETINDEFLPQKDNILKKGLDTLLEIVFNPLIEKNQFKEEYVQTEKENLKQIIEGKKDNKAKYALDRCTEEMYKDKQYGIYKFGYVEDLENINAQNLYEYYKDMISRAKIDIFVSGKVDLEETKKIISKNENIQKLQDRNIELVNEQELQKVDKPKTIKEQMDITQGKLVLGLTIENADIEEKYIALVYNTILGGGANSKLFQNVREKASLAYTAGSNYVRQMNNIFIRCGIETKNFDKAIEIINIQLEDMKNGNFTNEDIKNAKQTLISAIKFIPDEQDTEITYYFGGEIARKHVPLEEYETKIQEVTKEQIVNIANKISLHTIYFLTNKE